MKKVLIIIVIAAVAAFAAWYFFLKGNEEEATNKNVETEEVYSFEDEWNPYAAEDYHAYTLADQLLSAGGGKHIVKMNITIQFTTADGYYRFLGYSDRDTAEKESEAEGHGEETITPMELKINDTIGKLLMKANDTQLSERDIFKAYLKDGINEALGFKNPIIKEVFIENFILQ